MDVAVLHVLLTDELMVCNMFIELLLWCSAYKIIHNPILFFSKWECTLLCNCSSPVSSHHLTKCVSSLAMGEKKQNLTKSLLVLNVLRCLSWDSFICSTFILYTQNHTDFLHSTSFCKWLSFNEWCLWQMFWCVSRLPYSDRCFDMSGINSNLDLLGCTV